MNAEPYSPLIQRLSDAETAFSSLESIADRKDNSIKIANVLDLNSHFFSAYFSVELLRNIGKEAITALKKENVIYYGWRPDMYSSATRSILSYLTGNKEFHQEDYTHLKRVCEESGKIIKSKPNLFDAISGDMSFSQFY